MRIGDYLASVAAEWVWRLESLGWRGLLLVHGRGYAPVIASSVARGPVLVVASGSRRGVWSEAGFRVESPARVERLLGSEYNTVIIDVEPLLMPNLLAAVSEMLRAPGVLILAADCPWAWDPGGGWGSGGYARYLEASLAGMEALLRLDACTGRVLDWRLPERRAPVPWPPGAGGFESREFLLLPRAIRSLAATRDQAEALVAAYRFARGGYRSLFITGDRGRGKSAILGLILALLVVRREVGVVTVTAPSPLSVQSMFNLLTRALREAGIQHRVVERGGVVIGVRGAWFHIRYHTPDSLYEPGALLAVDEAAAIGVHRLRMFSRKARRLIAVSTVHGYEGSGRTLVHLVERILPQPMLRVELRTPIRYPPGDPLEEWLYETFVLRRLDVTPVISGSLECRWFEGRILGGDPSLARSLYSILAEAHYRNEPDDLALMLDLPYYRVYALVSGGAPVAVAEVSLEWLAEPSRRMLSSLVGLEGWRVARIVRIAVAPGLQRRGLGSRLLRCIESSLEADYIGAVYSRSDVTRFWLRNGYRIVYISPRFNRVTGEKNIAVLKSVRGPVSIVAEAERRARASLLLAGQTVYRDLPAEMVAEVLGVEPLLRSSLRVELEEWQVRDLQLFLRGALDHEAAWASVWPVTVSLLVSRGARWLGERRLVGLAARIVQGKPLSEVAAILGVGREEAARLVDEALRELLARAGLV